MVPLFSYIKKPENHGYIKNNLISVCHAHIRPAREGGLDLIRKKALAAEQYEHEQQCCSFSSCHIPIFWGAWRLYSLEYGAGVVG